MTDKQKLQVITAIVESQYEGSYKADGLSAIIDSIYAVICMEDKEC